MKSKVIVGLLLLLIAFLIGSYTSQPAEAQFAAPGSLDWVPYVSLVHVDDGTGNLVPTIRITGANVQIVNGLDATNGYPSDPDSTDPALTVTNSAGNLIVGYNELGNPSGDDRTGSHNLVFGHGNSFSSFGGLVGPNDSTISAAFASVSGGRANTASGNFSSVSGGRNNTASGGTSSVSGGRNNTASGGGSSVSGGQYNTASHWNDSVSGGRFNTVSGGWSTISGGEDNIASGQFSSVSGGHNRMVSGRHDWAAGSLFEDN